MLLDRVAGLVAVGNLYGVLAHRRSRRAVLLALCAGADRRIGDHMPGGVLKGHRHEGTGLIIDDKRRGRHRVSTVRARLFRRYPAWIGRVVFLQVAVPSRTDVATYQKLTAQVNQLVGSINGQFGTLSYQPVHYMYRSVVTPPYFRRYVKGLTVKTKPSRLKHQAACMLRLVSFDMIYHRAIVAI
ncbi:MAG: hypothetical protein EOO38_11995 [Cytophagaceae bacterium]|nr:MAG: hypothetical protein EOO38_11995 [Cytophagaceae bacterium]